MASARFSGSREVGGGEEITGFLNVSTWREFFVGDYLSGAPHRLVHSIKKIFEKSGPLRQPEMSFTRLVSRIKPAIILCLRLQ